MRFLRQLFGVIERFRPVAKSCRKCGADFRHFPREPETGTLVRFMKDNEFGERLMVTCHRCGFRFPEPTIEQKAR